MLIVLGGLPGVGKTTLARAFARSLPAVHLRIDSIEEAIRASGVTVSSLDDAGYRAAYAVAEDNLRLGHTVLADSVNPLPVTRTAWRDVGTRAGVSIVEVEIVCSDPTEHRRRIEHRLAGALPVGPTWGEVLARDYRPWDGTAGVVDTAGRTIDQSVADLRAAVRRSS